jgi:hypothetical protein
MMKTRQVMRVFIALTLFASLSATAFADDQVTLRTNLDLGGSLTIPKGSVLTLTREKASKTDWRIQRVKLPADATLIGMFTGEVALNSDECVRIASAGSEPVACTLPRKNSVSVAGTLSAATKVAATTWPAGTRLYLVDGVVKSATLSEPTLISGLLLKDGISFHPNGRVQTAILAANAELQGLTCKPIDGISLNLFSDGMIDDCYLAKSAKIDGYPAAADYVAFDRNDHARLAFFTLAKPRQIGRLKLKAGTMVHFETPGVIGRFFVKEKSFRIGKVVCEGGKNMPINLNADGTLKHCTVIPH